MQKNWEEKEKERKNERKKEKAKEDKGNDEFSGPPPHKKQQQTTKNKQKSHLKKSPVSKGLYVREGERRGLGDGGVEQI